MAGGINLHVYPSTFEYESRMERIGSALVDAALFDEVVFAGVWREGLAEWESATCGAQIHRVRSRFADRQSLIHRLLRFLSWSWLIFKHYRRAKVLCINCHSLSAFPVCVLLRFFTKARLVYDAHELETETHTMRGLRRILARVVERLCIHRADAHVFVSGSIARWYEKRYGLAQTHVVRNVPPTPTGPTPDRTNGLRRKFDIGEGAQLFLHQGMLQSGRGIEVMLAAFAELPSRNHIVLLGFGDLVDEIKRKAELHPNIHYHEPVAPEELAGVTQQADVGLHLIPNTCLNHNYCLPNKLFEYTHAGVPFIASDLPEIGNVTREFECGWTVEPSAKDLRQRIHALDTAALKTARAGCRRLAKECNWETERERLLKIYLDLGFSV
jgi:glycosyltransferase involved in cell wall biosynthesis